MVQESKWNRYNRNDAENSNRNDGQRIPEGLLRFSRIHHLDHLLQLETTNYAAVKERARAQRPDTAVFAILNFMMFLLAARSRILAIPGEICE